MAKISIQVLKTGHPIKCRIYLDEKKIGDVKQGEEKSFTATSGKHKMQINKFDLFHSPRIDFNLTEAGEIKFEAKSTGYIFLWYVFFIVIFLVIIPFLGDFIKSFLHFLPGYLRFSSFFILSGLAFFVLFYFFFGKKCIKIIELGTMNRTP